MHVTKLVRSGCVHWISSKCLRSSAVISRLDYYAGNPGSMPAGADFPTGI